MVVYRIKYGPNLKVGDVVREIFSVEGVTEEPMFSGDTVYPSKYGVSNSVIELVNVPSECMGEVLEIESIIYMEKQTAVKIEPTPMEVMPNLEGKVTVIEEERFIPHPLLLMRKF